MGTEVNATAAGDTAAGEPAAGALAKSPGEPEFDPMMPETNSTTAGDVFSDTAGDAANDAAAAGTDSNDTAGMQGAEGDATAAEAAANDALDAARDALEEAGIAIDEAAQAVANAESADELGAAETALANARVAVIIAGQDLGTARDILEGAEGGLAAGDQASLVAAERALGNANLAIIVATGSVMASQVDFPDSDLPNNGNPLPEGTVVIQGEGRGSSELDEALDASLVIFDNRIEASRDLVLDGTAPPATTGLPARQTRPSSQGTGQQGMESAESEDAAGDNQVIAGGRGKSQQVAVVDATSTLPEDIPDGQDDDIVARQLREAALAETNKDLQAKLWEEYRRYKTGN